MSDELVERMINVSIERLRHARDPAVADTCGLIILDEDPPLMAARLTVSTVEKVAGVLESAGQHAPAATLRELAPRQIAAGDVPLVIVRAGNILVYSHSEDDDAN